MGMSQGIKINTVIQGDCLEVMKGLSDNSVDIIFTDPPYALGSEIVIREDGKVDYAKAVDFMNKWDMPSGVFWEEWYKEANRVLKHGGHCLMFGMDRQLLLFKYYAHLAGFTEKQSLYWFFISNFPKATDLSKMIDKNGEGRHPEFAKFIKEARIKKGYSIAKVAELGGFYGKVNHGGAVTNWELGYNIPTTEQYNKLCEILDLPFKSIEEAEREVTGKLTTNLTAYQKIGEQNTSGEIDITAPSTTLAKKYSGYKYSIAPLKQTNETIMCFMKPTKTGSPLHDVLAMENGDNTITASCLDIDGNRVATSENLGRELSQKSRDSGVSLNASIKGAGSINDDWKSGRYTSQTMAISGELEYNTLIEYRNYLKQNAKNS